MVALYWIRNPGKPWKVFVANQVRKIAEIVDETGIVWKYCPTEKNLADLGSRGAGIQKMETGGWFTGPEWLLDKKQWPDQPDFESTRDVNNERKSIKEENLYAKEHKPDEWETIGEKQVLESPTSNGVDTEVPEQFLGETIHDKEADRTIDNEGDGTCNGSLDQEGPEEYVT